MQRTIRQHRDVSDIYLIEKINELVDASGEGDNVKDKRLRLPGEEGKVYRHIEIRVIEMSDDISYSLDAASKLDRTRRLYGS